MEKVINFEGGNIKLKCDDMILSNSEHALGMMALGFCVRPLEGPKFALYWRNKHSFETNNKLYHKYTYSSLDWDEKISGNYTGKWEVINNILEPKNYFNVLLEGKFLYYFDEFEEEDYIGFYEKESNKIRKRRFIDNILSDESNSLNEDWNEIDKKRYFIFESIEEIIEFRAASLKVLEEMKARARR